MNKASISEWKKKHTFYTFVTQAFLYGLATTIVQTSCWEYFVTLVHPQNLQLYYGVASSVVFIGPILFGVGLQRWIRHSKELRSSMFLFNMALLLGTICYMVPSHYVLPIIGQFLNGSILIVQSTIYSEITRAYSDNRLKEKIQILITSVTLGSIVGPLSNMIYLNYNFRVGNFHLMYGNSTLITILIVVPIQIFFIFVSTYNLPKLETKAKDPTINVDAVTSIMNTKFVVLIIMSFHSGLGMHLFRNSLPIICHQLNYNKNVANWCMMGLEAVTFIILCTVLHMKLASDEIYYTGTYSLVVFIVHVFGIQLLTKVNHKAVNIFLIVATILMYSIFNALTQTFLVVTCRRLVPPNKREIGENIRSTVTMIGRLLGAFFSAYIYQRFWFFTAVNTLWCFCMILYLKYRKL